MQKRGHGFKDLTGLQFHRLRVVSLQNIVNRKAYWLCQCECGKTKSVQTGNLRSGAVKSCGCLQRERASESSTTHGSTRNRTKPAEYGIWLGIKKRCLNPDTHAYHHYGGRGISIFPAWIDSFGSFFAYVGKRPSVNLTIERIDNNGNYEPGNIRWATRTEQCNNTRRNTFLEFQGERKTVANWARQLGINVQTLWSRIANYKWPIDIALTQPVRKAITARRVR